MAFGNIYFYLFTALVAVNIIFADETFEAVLSDNNQVDLSDSASREARSPPEEEGAEERLFFNLFPLIVPCNYTATPGPSCASCRQAVRCLPNNNGILRICRGFLPYCNAGRCSFFPDPVACNGTAIG